MWKEVRPKNSSQEVFLRRANYFFFEDFGPDTLRDSFFRGAGGDYPKCLCSTWGRFWYGPSSLSQQQALWPLTL